MQSRARKTLTENPGPPTPGKNESSVTETTGVNMNQDQGGAGIADTGTTTTMGQSLREAHRPTRSLASPRTTLTIGHWNVRTQEGRRKRGRPKTTWRRMVEKERNSAGWKTWSAVHHAAADRAQWKRDVQALCAPWHREDLRLKSGKLTEE